MKRIFAVFSTGVTAAVVVALPVCLVACNPDLGERCNPMRFVDNCEHGTACIYPPNCGVAFCCPTDGFGNNPNCQPCPPLDGGATD
jgi:hypothetical protein